MTHQFILEGNGPMANRGCEAILTSTMDLLGEQFGPCRFVNAPAAMDTLDAYAGIEGDLTHRLLKPIGKYSPAWVVSRIRRYRGLPRDQFNFKRDVKRSSATLAVGGDNYSLDYGDPARFFRANDVTLSAGKPVILWGASVGPFDRDKDFEAWAAGELRKITLICARESETVEYLARIGVSENVKQVADPAFCLKPRDAELPETVEKMLQGPCVGLNLSWLIGRYVADAEGWPVLAGRCARSILEATDLPLLLVPHVFSSRSDDHALLEKVMAELADFGDRVVLLGRNYSAGQLKRIISRLTVFAGARTHSTIAALSSCVPTLSIGYSMKAKGLNKDLFGHDRWLLPADELDGDVLGSRVKGLLDESESVRSHLESIMDEYKDRSRLAVRHVAEIVESC